MRLSPESSRIVDRLAAVAVTGPSSPELVESTT